MSFKIRLYKYYLVFEKRYEASILYNVLITLIAVAASFIIAGLIFELLGFSSIQIYGTIVNTFISLGLM